MSSIITTTEMNHTVAIIGTDSNGELLKVSIYFKKYICFIGFLHQWDDASIFVSEQIELTIVEFISSSSLGVIHYFFLENVGRNY